MVTVKCTWCGKSVRRYKSKLGIKCFCTKLCESRWRTEYYTDPEHRKECNTWQGRKHKQSTRLKMSRNMRGIKKRPLTQAERQVQHSFWTPERRRKQRRDMEALGLWTPLTLKDDWSLYKIQSNWTKSMLDHLSPELLKQVHTIGIFDVERNKNGLVRHHLFPRYDGFVQGVFPPLLRHPCNCGILRNHDNHHRSAPDITLGELFTRIEAYTGKWLEQAICLDYIRRFNNGERWDKNTYIDSWSINHEQNNGSRRRSRRVAQSKRVVK